MTTRTAGAVRIECNSGGRERGSPRHRALGSRKKGSGGRRRRSLWNRFPLADRSPGAAASRRQWRTKCDPQHGLRKPKSATRRGAARRRPSPRQAGIPTRWDSYLVTDAASARLSRPLSRPTTLARTTHAPARRAAEPQGTAARDRGRGNPRIHAKKSPGNNVAQGQV